LTKHHKIRMNKILFYRQKLNFTQTELSEKSGLSLRTIQRIESGNIPKNHTLKAIAKVFEIDIDELREKQEFEEDENLKFYLVSIKFLNISALLFLIIPFGNLIFPILLWYRNRKDTLVNKVGLQIINIQIIWTIILCASLVLSPLIQKMLLLKFSLLLVVFFIMAILNIYTILINTISISRDLKLKITSPINFF
jgi:transcriptional regulator with XRE-family HTH domain